MGLKYGVITDIHGNDIALKEVLKKLEEEEVEHIYCLGDLISIGPMTNEVLERLSNLKNITFVCGNHDQSILSLLQGKEQPPGHEMASKHHEWIVKTIDRKYISFIEEMPRLVYEYVEGQRVLAMHYHIDPNDLYCPIDENPFSTIVEPSLLGMEQLFHDYQADIILFGHHHPTHFFVGENTIYYNPGSLGCSHTPYAKYGIIHFDQEVIEVETKSVRYPRDQFVQAYMNRFVPERKFLLKAFYGINI